MLLLLTALPRKYFYQMSLNTDKSYHKINLKESYAVLQKPTIATVISKKTLEANEEKTNLRQKSEIIYFKSKLAKNKKTKRQKEEKSTKQNISSKTIGHA